MQTYRLYGTPVPMCLQLTCPGQNLKLIKSLTGSFQIIREIHDRLRSCA